MACVCKTSLIIAMCQSLQYANQLTLLHPLFFEANANDISDSIAYTAAYVGQRYSRHALIQHSQAALYAP